MIPARAVAFDYTSEPDSVHAASASASALTLIRTASASGSVLTRIPMNGSSSYIFNTSSIVSMFEFFEVFIFWCFDGSGKCMVDRQRDPKPYLPTSLPLLLPLPLP